MKPELKQFINNLESEDVESLFSIHISKNTEPNLEGVVKPYVTTVSFVEPEKMYEEDYRAIKQHLWCIADIIMESLDEE